MCFDISAIIETQLRRARMWNKEIARRLADTQMDLQMVHDYHHVNAFDHPGVFIYTKEQAHIPEVATWGLIPRHTRSKEEMLQLWNKTLNARGEDLFKRKSYQESAKSKRCIIDVDGFYEHQHFNGKTYPYFIEAADKKPLTLAGLWDEWEDPHSGHKLISFSIVTCKANELMSQIHNNPKLPEPRMPLILTDKTLAPWLNLDAQNDSGKKEVLALVKPVESDSLKSHTVKKLRGKEATGNKPEASLEHRYPELENKQGSLF